MKINFRIFLKNLFIGNKKKKKEYLPPTRRVKEGALGFIPNEDQILKMSPENQKMYFEAKKTVESINKEYGTNVLPFEEFCHKLDNLGDVYSFEQMCDLWKFAGAVAFLAEKSLNFEFQS